MPVAKSGSENEGPESHERISAKAQMYVLKMLKCMQNHLFKKEVCILHRNLILCLLKNETTKQIKLVYT